MAVLAKPNNSAFVVSASKKEEFRSKSKDSDSFNRLMERTAHVTSAVRFDGVNSKNGKNR
jgi:hypothetical protein